MSFQRALAGAGSCVPQPDRIVFAAGRKKPAVRRKGGGNDGTAAWSHGQGKPVHRTVETFLLVPVTNHRASAVGLLEIIVPLIVLARTIWVVVAAKLLEKLVLHPLTVLGLQSTETFAGTIILLVPAKSWDRS